MSDHSCGDPDDECDDDVPEWPLRWTIFPVVGLMFIRDVAGAFYKLWDNLLDQVIAFHNMRAQTLIDLDTLRLQIESLPTTGEPDGQQAEDEA